jgi:hypothetical protein
MTNALAPGLAALPVLFALTATALEPEDVFAGRMIISEHELPMEYSSARKYVKKMKQLQRTSIRLATIKTKLYYAAFFAKPVRDVQVDVVLYDVTDGTRVKKNAWETFLASPSDRALFGNFEFDRSELAANRKYQLVIATRGRIIASGEVHLSASVVRRTQELDFSEPKK